MRLNLHARIELGLAAALLLGSCAGPALSEKQREEVSDIASDEIADGINDSAKVSELEARVEALEQKLNM